MVGMSISENLETISLFLFYMPHLYLPVRPVFKQALNLYKQKFREPILYEYTKIGLEHNPTWRITCTSESLYINL